MQVALVIEDDPAALIAWAFVLRSYGFTVLEANSRGEAWRICHQYQGPIHFVVAKASLDNHHTGDFVARLRLVYPQIRALFVSDEPPSELADESSIPYEYAWLQKPFQVDVLDDTISRLLNRPKKRAASPS